MGRREPILKFWAELLCSAKKTNANTIWEINKLHRPVNTLSSNIQEHEWAKFLTTKFTAIGIPDMPELNIQKQAVKKNTLEISTQGAGDTSNRGEASTGDRENKALGTMPLETNIKQ